jgi:hypothetical protein
LMFAPDRLKPAWLETGISGDFVETERDSRSSLIRTESILL